VRWTAKSETEKSAEGLSCVELQKDKKARNASF